jgi:hypothetical protein
MSSSSPPDDKAIALRRSMTLHHRDVQQNCSLESDIKRNQCPVCFFEAIFVIFSDKCVESSTLCGAYLP